MDVLYIIYKTYIFNKVGENVESVYVILNLVVFIGLGLVVYWMQRKHFSFSKRVFTALGLGILFGGILQMIYGYESNIVSTSIDWFKIVGNGYVGFLQMIVIPLIMVAIISAITRLKASKGIGKMAVWVIGMLIFTTLIAAVIGIFYANVFDLNADAIQAGEMEIERGEAIEERVDTATTSIPQKILSVIPTNPFADMTGARSTSTIAVVIFSVLVGIAALKVKRRNEEAFASFTKIVEAFYAVVMQLVKMILKLTPYGILALMTVAVASTSWNGVKYLLTFVLASYLALITMFIIHLLLLAAFGLNPMQYVKKTIPVLSFAFTSRTSAGTMPLTIETQTKQLGVSEGIANFAASFGASIGQNGCAGIYPAMLAVMIAPTVGINPLDPLFILQLLVVVTISSFGVAGVGGGATFAAIIVLSTMNLPVALAGLLVSVEPLIDLGRTALNVSGAMTSGVISSKALGQFDADIYRAKLDSEDDTDFVS